jgi:hypothetical protein
LTIEQVEKEDNHAFASFLENTFKAAKSHILMKMEEGNVNDKTTTNNKQTTNKQTTNNKQTNNNTTTIQQTTTTRIEK